MEDHWCGEGDGASGGALSGGLPGRGLEAWRRVERGRGRRTREEPDGGRRGHGIPR